MCANVQVNVCFVLTVVLARQSSLPQFRVNAAPEDSVYDMTQNFIE
jgi:hypothetical protein